MGLGRGDAPGGVGGGSWTPAMAFDAAAGVSTGDGIDYGGIDARTDCVSALKKVEVAGDRQKF